MIYRDSNNQLYKCKYLLDITMGIAFLFEMIFNIFRNIEVLLTRCNNFLEDSCLRIYLSCLTTKGSGFA